MGGEGLTLFLVVLTICTTVVMLRGLRLKYRHEKTYDSDDARIMQEINRGLQRMESRVESLETLIMDQPRRGSARYEMD